MNWIWRIALFVVALVVFAAASAPLSAVARRSDNFDYARASGTIWNGVLEEARIGGLAAGDVTVRVSAAALLQGRLEARATANGPALMGDLLYEAGLSGARRVAADTLAIQGVAVGRDGPRMSDFPGRTLLTGLDIRFADGRCASAAGHMESDVLVRTAERFGQTGLFLSGGARCVEDAARITLAGEEEPDAVRVSVDLKADGSGSWLAEAHTDKQAFAAVLIDAGLTPAGEGGALAGRGDFRWSPL